MNCKEKKVLVFAEEIPVLPESSTHNTYFVKGYDATNATNEFPNLS